jgi:hypothetical protein
VFVGGQYRPPVALIVNSPKARKQAILAKSGAKLPKSDGSECPPGRPPRRPPGPPSGPFRLSRSGPPSRPVSRLLSRPKSRPKSRPLFAPGFRPVSRLVSRPGSAPGFRPGSRPLTTPLSRPLRGPLSQPRSGFRSGPLSHPLSRPVRRPMSGFEIVDSWFQIAESGPFVARSRLDMSLKRPNMSYALSIDVWIPMFGFPPPLPHFPIVRADDLPTHLRRHV